MIDSELTGLGPPPDYLPAEAKEIWNLVVRECGQRLKEIDRFTLERYVTAVVIARNSAQAILQNKVSNRKGGLTLAKAITLWRSSAEESRRAEEQLGLSPQARARLARFLPKTTSNEVLKYLKLSGKS
ncbi:MAG: phage terminase small subunit P27 family [Gemmatales bacterium]|nr:phage terminase small subunit P27 family [Gemmatales bacterium]MDW8175126.1 phage terminase small subunit P27 family [Gemmatales bacterium]